MSSFPLLIFLILSKVLLLSWFPTGGVGIANEFVFWVLNVRRGNAALLAASWPEGPASSGTKTLINHCLFLYVERLYKHLLVLSNYLSGIQEIIFRNETVFKDIYLKSLYR
jgi:hypothetical protein